LQTRGGEGSGGVIFKAYKSVRLSYMPSKSTPSIRIGHKNTKSRTSDFIAGGVKS